MSIKERYNLPPATWKNMIRDGVISCAVVKYDEILSKYNAKIGEGIEHTRAVALTADEIGVSMTWVYKIIRLYK